MSTESTNVIHASVPMNGSHQQACFERVLPLIQAVPREKWITPTVDPVYGASVALRASPRFMTYRDRMRNLGPELKQPLLDAVCDLAHAVSYVCGEYVPRTANGESLADLLREGLQLRDVLSAVKDVCERMGLVQGEALVQNPRLTGSRNVSRDLTALKRFFDESAPQLAGKIPVTPRQLDRAGYIAACLLAGDPGQESAPTELSDAEQLKLQTFSCFMIAYSEVRAAVALLRRDEGDAEEIAPSVYAGRAQPRRKEPDGPVPAPAPSTGTPGPAPTTPAPVADEVPVGHMGGNPFAS